MQPLSKGQTAVFEFIRDRILQDKGPPSFAEISDRFGFKSLHAVTGYLRRLEGKGWITRQAGKSRAIGLAPEVLEQSRGNPCPGVVAAGALHEAVEGNEYIDFPGMFRHKDLFVLTVEGDSMVGAHIRDGDYILVRRQKTAEPGQIAVVRTPDGEATVKYWFPERKQKRIRLQPANANLEPIYVKHAEVIGVVAFVVRRGA